MSSIQDDEATWKANFMANIESINQNYQGGDVDAFASALADKIPEAPDVDTRSEFENALSGGDLEQAQRIFNDYENNSTVPSTNEIKELIVMRSDSVTLDENADLDSQVSSALDEYASDWSSNWSSSFGF